MRNVVAIAGFSLALAVAGSTAAQTGEIMAGSAPGKAGVAQTLRATLTITAIDKATRDVTLKGPEGKELIVTAGPDVKNFDRMKVGDLVDVKYVEALTLELKKGGGLPVQRTEDAGVKGAKKGALPAGVAGRQITVIANVIALDAKKQSVTLRGPQRTVDLVVSDPEQFKRIAVGDQVEATYTQALAIAVEPAKK